MALNCFQVIGLLLLYQVSVCEVSSNGGYLKPDKPVRRVREYLTFLCGSPDHVGKEPEITASISHNGRELEVLKPSGITSANVLQFKYYVTDISMKTAGTWDCNIKNGNTYSFSQNLIIVEGNSTPALAEDESTVVIDCLTDEDKTRGVRVKWRVNNMTVNTTSDFSMHLRDISINDARKNISCTVSQNGSQANSDDEASTSIDKPLAVVHFEKDADMIKIKICGWTSNVDMSSAHNESTCSFLRNNTEGCVQFQTNITCLQLCIKVEDAIFCKNTSDIKIGLVYGDAVENNKVSAIVGGIVGGIAGGLLLAVLFTIAVRKWFKHWRDKESERSTRLAHQGCTAWFLCCKTKRKDSETDASNGGEMKVFIQKEQSQSQSRIEDARQGCTAWFSCCQTTKKDSETDASIMNISRQGCTAWFSCCQTKRKDSETGASSMNT